MKKGKIIFLYFLILIHINFYKNVKIKKKWENIFYLYNTPPINKQKQKFQLKNTCTFLTGIKVKIYIQLNFFLRAYIIIFFTVSLLFLHNILFYIYTNLHA